MEERDDCTLLKFLARGANTLPFSCSKVCGAWTMRGSPSGLPLAQTARPFLTGLVASPKPAPGFLRPSQDKSSERRKQRCPPQGSCSYPSCSLHSLRSRCVGIRTRASDRCQSMDETAHSQLEFLRAVCGTGWNPEMPLPAAAVETRETVHVRLIMVRPAASPLATNWFAGLVLVLGTAPAERSNCPHECWNAASDSNPDHRRRVRPSPLRGKISLLYAAPQSTPRAAFLYTAGGARRH